jgi:hypothetical protein
MHEANDQPEQDLPSDLPAHGCPNTPAASLQPLHIAGE